MQYTGSKLWNFINTVLNPKIILTMPHLLGFLLKDKLLQTIKEGKVSHFQKSFFAISFFFLTTYNRQSPLVRFDSKKRDYFRHHPVNFLRWRLKAQNFNIRE